MKPNKQAQITLFIIIGIVIIITFSLFTYLGKDTITSDFENQQEEVLESSLLVPVVKNYLQSCLANELEDGLFLMGYQAGYLTIPSGIEFVPVYYSDVPYWIIEGKDISPSIKDMEGQISGYITDYSKICILQLEEVLPDADITFKGFEVNTTIGENQIDATARLQLRLIEKQTVQKISEVQITIPVPYGKVVKTAQQIIQTFEEDPSSIDLTALAQMPLETTIYDIDEFTKVIAIRDYNAILKEDAYQFVFAVKLAASSDGRPIIEEIPMFTASVGEEIVIDVNATDNEGDNVKFSLVSFDYEIDEMTGMIRIVPDEEGMINMIVEAEDQKGNSAAKNIVINITSMTSATD